MRTNPRPTAEAIGQYYPEDYAPFESTRVAERPVSPAGSFKRKLQGMFDFQNYPLPEREPGRMLEIGCASGLFMREMARRGWQVRGIEPSPAAAAAARALGFDVYNGQIEVAPDPGIQYDLITAWMVLEHLHEPVAVLRRLCNWSHPETQLVLSVPNAGSWEFGLFRDAWYALDLPRHLYHFTPRTLEAVLRAGGWSLQRVFFQRDVANVVASIGYRMRDARLPGADRLVEYPERRGRGDYYTYPLAWVLSQLGQTGRMVVWATPA